MCAHQILLRTSDQCRAGLLAQMSEKRKAYTVFVEKPETDCLENLGINGKII
jgi:hypothetical protein